MSKLLKLYTPQGEEVKWVFGATESKETYNTEGDTSPEFVFLDGSRVHIKDLLVGETFDTATPYPDWIKGQLVESVIASTASSQIQTTSFINGTDVVPKEWVSLWALLSESGDFTWGSNNRSLVTASSFKHAAEQALDVSEPDYESGETDDDVESRLEESINYYDYLAFIKRLEDLGETYIDLEN